MSYLLIRYKTGDYPKWKRAVQGGADWRKASGELCFQILRSSMASRKFNSSKASKT